MSNASGFYGWMLSGERVYQALAPHYELFSSGEEFEGRVCFETFPHAVTCAMLGKEVALAKQKRVQRRAILQDAGVETVALRSIDAVDAALCALTANFLLEGRVHAYGDTLGGYIVVPSIDGRT